MEEDVKYLRIALALQNIGITERLSEQVIRTYKKIKDLGGEFSLDDAVEIEIEIEIERKYKEKELKKE